MSNLEVARHTDHPLKSSDKNGGSAFDLSDLYKGRNLTKPEPDSTLAGFPPAATLLPPEVLRVGSNEMPHDFKVGNAPRLGSGTGGDYDFGQAPWLRGTPDYKELLPDLKVGNIPGPGSRAPGARLESIPGNNPADDIKPNGDRQAGKLGDEAEQRLAANARHAANILNDKGDLGNEYQRNQIKEMYKKALEEGGHQAVEKLTQAINKELEKRGSNVRVSSDMAFSAIPPGDGIRLRVMKGPQQVDEARISRTSPWERRNLLDSF
jgi:hypothetical protein